jgi:hypothetical protein
MNSSSCSLLVVATLFHAISFQSIAIPLRISSVRRRSLPFLFCSFAYLLCAVPLPYCTQLFHCLSTDRRPAPFHSYASQILSIALLCRSSPLLRLASPFHRFSIPGLASLFRCVAVPGSHMHIRAPPRLSISARCSSYPFLRMSALRQSVSLPNKSFLFPAPQLQIMSSLNRSMPPLCKSTLLRH